VTVANAASILSTVKKILGLDDANDVFDLDIVVHINSVIVDLNQLGIGPVDGFEITGPDETWDSYLGSDPNLNAVKSYMYLRVRLLFDPPGTSYLINAMTEQILKAEWRLNTAREGVAWIDPTPVTVPEDL
jgi:hypothetical protein